MGRRENGGMHGYRGDEGRYRMFSSLILDKAGWLRDRDKHPGIKRRRGNGPKEGTGKQEVQREASCVELTASAVQLNNSGVSPCSMSEKLAFSLLLFHCSLDVYMFRHSSRLRTRLNGF